MADATRNPVTFSPEQLQAVIAEAIAAHDKNKQAQAKDDTTDQMNSLCIRAFKKAGYGDVTPRVDTKTYSLWMKEGFKVKPGEKSVAVKSLRLFHRSQVQPVSKTEQAEYFAKLEAKKSDRFLPNGSPVSTQPAPTPVPLKPSKPQPKSEPEVEAAKKSKAGRSKPDGTGPQPIV